ncbi:MAG: Na+/H+ antiporter NhaC [Desulfurivibrionaceae bacterium]
MTADPGNENNPKPGLLGALLPVAVTMTLMLVQLIVFDEFAPHIPLVLGTAFSGVLAWSIGYKWRQMETGLFHVVHIGLPSVAILMTVGMIIGTWILSGTVPLLIYYGLKMITPQYFPLAAMLITSVVSVAIGTSWGTVGTVGLALVGIGDGLGIPAYLTGGAIVSGAFFGDKMSPLSDTTNLAPAVTSTKLFSHIRNMMATAVPAMVITAVVYWGMGLEYADQTLHTSRMSTIVGGLEKQFVFHPFLLIPALLVIILAVKRFPALPTLFVGMLAGAVTAMIAQDASVHQIFTVMQNGYESATGIEAVDRLLSKGGIQSMMWTISLVLIALAFGGILEKSRCLEVILNSVIGWVRGRFSLVAISTGGAVGTNLITGDPYLAIALPGRMFSPVYRGKGLSTLNLSRSIEEGGTLINPLVPWSAGGAFTAAALGIPTLVYAPMAIACWLSPLIGLFYAGLGWFMPEADQDERRQWQQDGELIMTGNEVVNADELDVEELEKAFDKYRSAWKT